MMPILRYSFPFETSTNIWKYHTFMLLIYLLSDDVYISFHFTQDFAAKQSKLLLFVSRNSLKKKRRDTFQIERGKSDWIKFEFNLSYRVC